MNHGELNRIWSFQRNSCNSVSRFIYVPNKSIRTPPHYFGKFCDIYAIMQLFLFSKEHGNFIWSGASFTNID